MNKYITDLNQFRAIYGAEIDKLNDDVNLESICDLAGGIVDDYVVQITQSREFTPVPAILSAWCMTIARHYLFRNPTEEQVAEYNRVIKSLEQLSQGKLVIGGLPVATPEPETVTENAFVNFTSATRICDRGSTQGW